MIHTPKFLVILLFCVSCSYSLFARPVAFKNLLDFEVGLYLSSHGEDAVHALQSITLSKGQTKSVNMYSTDEVWYIKVVESGTVLVRLEVDETLFDRTPSDPWIITSSFVEFVNYSSGVVDVYHVTGDGRQLLYNTLESYDSYVQGTYEGHKWLLKSRSSGNTMHYKASNGLNTFQYKEDWAIGKRMDAMPDLSRKYDKVTYLTAHNAFSNKEDNWTNSQQSFTITKLLDIYGVRGLDLDVYVRNGELIMCHGAYSCGKSFKSALEEINQFLISNPNDVVTIFIESEEGWNPDSISNQLFMQTYKDSGILDKIYWPDPNPQRPNARSYNVYNERANTYEWPTLQEMINDGRRLVIFQDRFVANELRSVNPYVWKFAIENTFSDQDHWYLTSNGCDEREESKHSIYHLAPRALFKMNHIPKISATTFYFRANRLARLLEHAKDCSSEHNRVPNFISLDYVETGGGIELVKLINDKIWSSSNPVDELKKFLLTRQEELKK